MAMTLGVRAVGAKRDGLVFVGFGVDPESVEYDYPRPFFEVVGSVGDAIQVQEQWPEGFGRAVLIASIYREAIACGCSTIVSEGGGCFRRADTGALLADCNVSELLGV